MEAKKEIKFDIVNKFIVFVATGGYTGFLPFAPGTFGTLWGIFFFYLLFELQPLVYCIITLLLFFLGVWISTRAEILLGNKDDKKIVIDEIVGMMFSLAFIPKKLELVIAAFILFRIFDIFKPIKKLEKIRGGMGVMADDLFAGILANGILQIYVYNIM